VQQVHLKPIPCHTMVVSVAQSRSSTASVCTSASSVHWPTATPSSKAPSIPSASSSSSSSSLKEARVSEPSDETLRGARCGMNCMGGGFERSPIPSPASSSNSPDLGFLRRDGGNGGSSIELHESPLSTLSAKLV